MAADLARVEVVVTGDDMIKIRENLTIEGDTASGVIQVPVGEGRLFVLNGFDSAGILSYSGSDRADVVEGVTVRVEITMRPVGEDGTQIPGLSGAIVGLEFIEVGVVASSNWDRDIEDDGLLVGVFYRDVNNDFVYWDAIVAGDTRIFIADDVLSETKKEPDPVFVGLGHPEVLKSMCCAPFRCSWVRELTSDPPDLN